VRGEPFAECDVGARVAGAVVDHHAARPQPVQRPPVFEQIGDVGVVAQAEQQHVHGCGQFGHAVVPGVRGSGQRLKRRRSARPRVQVIAAVGDGSRHRGALVAQADESRCGYRRLLSCGRSGSADQLQ
jgi:hypothetical protein